MTVLDSFTDLCDPLLTRTYVSVPPHPGGPVYSEHGDYNLTVTATDEGSNSTSDSVFFTIDTVPPVVQIIQPPVDQTGLPPVSIPITVRFTATDDDGGREALHTRS